MENNIDEVESAVNDIKLDTTEDRIETAHKLNSAISSEQFAEILKQWSNKYTPEYIEELGRRCYEDDRNYPENFSNWYPHIKDFGYFRSAEIISNQIFTYEETEKFRKTDNIKDVDWNELVEILKPTLSKMERFKVYSIKNGCFSNKFEFETCLATKMDLAEKLWKINYRSAELETGGYTELVVRELIPHNIYTTPTIYGGMPIREEVRVFYNMDTNSIEYIEDYWKYKYCRPNIRDKSDQIVFDWFHNKLKTRKVQHREVLRKIEDILYENIHTLKFDGELKGIWSIDFMYIDEGVNYDGLWLIDMARGFRSAYWNIDKLTYTTRKQLIEESKNGK